MTVDDRYLDGVYYDGNGGGSVRIERDEETGEAILINMEGEEEARLGPEEWREYREDFMPVPEAAVDDPVGYYERVVETLRRDDHNFDQGFMFADEVTKVVKRD
jgi:hypothetical protein